MANPDELSEWIAERLAALGLEWPGIPARPERAVVGIDGLEPSKEAVRWTAELCAELHHVAALGLYLMPGDEAEYEDEGSDAPMGTVRSIAHDMLERYRPLAGTAKVTDHLVRDTPPAAILHVADDVDADLVAVGHSDKSVLERLFLGSASEAVAHRSPLPTLVATTPPGDGPILCALGDDEGSQHAAAWAAGLATWTGAPLVLVHVNEEGLAPEGFGSLSVLDGADAVGVEGDVDAAVVEYAGHVGAQLLVVGHGRRPGWLGSHAIKMIRRAPCTVLVGRYGSA